METTRGRGEPMGEDLRVGGARGWLLTDEWPLVGRDAELRQIDAARVAGRRTGVVIVGEQGVGKSHLVRSALQLAHDSGATTWSVIGSQAAQAIPFGAFAHLLRTDQPTTDPLELLRRAMGEIRGGDAGEGLVVSIDNAHCLDEVSAALVHQLALALDVFVIVSLPDGAPASDAIAGLLKDGLATRLGLAPLTRESVAELCQVVLGGDVEHGTAHRIWEATRGNPLLLRELVLDGVDGEQLTGEDGVWRWRGHFGAGTRLRELVEQRLVGLDVAERHGLEVLAFGEPLLLECLEVVVGGDVVAALDGHGLLRVDTDGGRTHLRIAQSLYGEVLRESASPLRARSIQRQLAEVVDVNRMDHAHEHRQVAKWRLEGGVTADPGSLLTAARHAEASFDFVLAARMARAALEAGDSADGAAQRVLASALRGQGRPADAELVWAGLQQAATDDAELVDAVFGRSMNLLFGLGSASAALGVLGEAEAFVSTAAATDALATQRALIALYAGRPLDALRIAEPVLAAPGQTRVNAIYAAVSVGPALAGAGRIEEAHAAIDKALPLAFELVPSDGVVDGTQLAGLLLAAKFLAHLVGGDVSQALAVGEATHAMAVEIGSHDGMAGLGCAVGLGQLAVGRPRSAVRQLREAAVLLRDQDRNRYLPWCLSARANGLALMGDTDGAEEALREADELRTPGILLFETEVERARACLAAARGDVDLAERILLDAAADARFRGQVGFEAHALHDVVRLGRCTADLVERLRRVVDGSDAVFARRAIAHAEAVLIADGAALERVARDFEQSGALLHAAEVTADASACHRAAGRADRAMVVAERARALLALCEGARPPGFTLLTADAPALTPREREVAGLAGEGLSSKVIASRLSLSVRTVDNHLHRAYDKLGVRSRQELALLLGLD